MRGSSITKRYRFLAFGLLAAALAGGALAQGVGTPPRSVEAAQTDSVEPAAEPAEARPGERATFIVRLHDAPAARYRGGLPGLPATSRQAGGLDRFRADTSDVQAYRGYLKTRQQEVLDGIREQLGVDLDPDRRWQLALNGFAVELDRRTARRLEALPEIASVEEEVEHVPLTFAGPDYIGAPAAWTGSIPGGVSTRGEDTVIAVVDSGIRASHEAFAETAADGYSHTNPLGDGNFIGVCDPNSPDYDDQYPCNNKLIGAFHFNGDSANDQDGHGTHVAGTAAGNPVTTPNGVELSGVAPRANLINYRICAPGCTGMVDVAEHILDPNNPVQVDIVNYSIGPQDGGGDAYGDSSSQAFLSLHEAGILVFAAGGNAGPTESSISNFAPWNVTVGSSDHGGRLSHNVTVTGPGTPPAALEDIFALPWEDFSLAADREGDAVLVESVDAGNEQACEALPANSLDGVIGVAEAGACDFEFKSEHMADAGAIGMVLYSGEDYDAHFVMGGTFPIPSVWIDFPEHGDFLAWLRDNPDSTVRIDADPTQVNRRPDVMSDFSARGPANNIYRELLGPDLVAAGDSILAPYTGADDAYRRIGGTSMASPHAAGTGALLRALQPGWSPAELQSALMMTAVPDVLTEADGSAASPFAQGAGRLDVAAAADAGLVMDESYARFVDADPDGGSLSLHELNIPFLSRHECPADGCSWTRTVKAVQDGSWTATTEAADISIDVEPATFSLTAGESQTLTVTVTDVPEGWDWHFGRVRLSEDGGGAAEARLPVAVTPVPPPLVVVDEEGEAVASDALEPGQPLTLTIEGGSGDFSVEAMPNPVSGATPRVTLDGRQLTLTAPDTGAFAGRYQLVVTDEGTGRTTTVEFEVGLKFAVDATHLFPGDSKTVQVLGATPGYGMAFAIEDGEGHPSTAATVELATDQAADDEPAANPAETVVSIGELDETEHFTLAVTPEDGTYDPVALDMSGDPGRFYSGWVQDEFGDPLSAEVATAEPVGPAEAIYAAPADEDGIFRLQTPLPPAGEEHELSVSRPGYVTNRYAGGPCVGEEPQCTLTLFEATAALSGTVSGLAEGERVRLYLATTGPEGEELELGPDIVVGEGNESEPFRLDASHRSSYEEIRGRGFGYRDFSANDDGRPFRFSSEGDEIDGIELEAVPTSPAVEQLTVVDSGRESGTVRLRVHPRERDGNVTLQYGEDADEPDRSLDPVAVAAGDGWQTLEFELAELACGTEWHVRAMAENDRERTGQSSTASFRTTSCDGPEKESSSCSLGPGTARLDPLLPSLALLALFGLAGRRRRA